VPRKWHICIWLLISNYDLITVKPGVAQAETAGPTLVSCEAGTS
jgi:hypothetical protein